LLTERDASVMFKHLWRGWFLRRGYRGFVRVIQRGEKSGLIHVHVLAVLPSGFKSGYHDSRNCCHRSKWFKSEQAAFGGVVSKYGFGRVESFSVLRKGGLAVGRYFGRYVSRAIDEREGSHERMWSCSRVLSIGAVSRTASNLSHAWVWRQRVKEWCRERGVESYAAALDCWGPAFQYDFAASIRGTDLPHGLEYPSKWHARASGNPVGEWFPDGEWKEYAFPQVFESFPRWVREVKAQYARLAADERNREVREEYERQVRGEFNGQLVLSFAGGV